MHSFLQMFKSKINFCLPFYQRDFIAVIFDPKISKMNQSINLLFSMVGTLS